MKKFVLALLTLCFVFTLGIAGLGASARGIKAAPREKTAADRIGVTHAAGFYSFDPSVSYLEEGAKLLETMGSKVIKVWLSQESTSNYIYHSEWDKYSPTNLVAMIKTPYYQNLLKMDFNTYIFEAHEFDSAEGGLTANWIDGMDEKELRATEDQIYELAKYLMQNFAETGKNFVLQNWEGDNMLGANFIKLDAETGYYCEMTDRVSGTYETPTEETDARVKTKINGFIDWANARQKGVDRARAQYGDLGVQVDNVLEVCFAPLSEGETYIRENWPILIKTVVPYVDADMFSLSSWSTQGILAQQSLIPRLADYKAAIGANYYDKEDTAHAEPKARRNAQPRMMLGEFGTCESLATNDFSRTNVYNEDTDRIMRLANRAMIEQALDFGMEYIMYWELYCNEARKSIDTASGEMAEKNEDVVGFYLIRPDGTYTSLYYSMQAYFGGDGLSINETTLPVDNIFTSQDRISFIEIDAFIDMTGLNNQLSDAISGRAAFKDKIGIEVSEDGKDWEKIQTDAVFSFEKSGKSKIIFTNAEAIPESARKIKLIEQFGDNTVEILAVRAYRHNEQKLTKLNVTGTYKDETLKQTTFKVGTGETVKLDATMTDAAWAGEIEFKSLNRYIATVDETGLITGRTNGICVVTVTASGGGLPQPVVVRITVNVDILGEELLTDTFDGYDTIGYAGDRWVTGDKRDEDRLPDFGKVTIEKGSSQKFLETDNMQFYDSVYQPFIEEYYGADTERKDIKLGYILDWNNRSNASVTYESIDGDIGGYRADVLSYAGSGIFDRVQMYISSDLDKWTKITSYIVEQKAIANAGGWYRYVIGPKQVIPEGTIGIKCEIKVAGVNKWEPQLAGISLFGEAAVPAEFVDNDPPTIEVSGSYQTKYDLNETIKISAAAFADSYEFAPGEKVSLEELETSIRVFADINGALIEQPLSEEGELTLSIATKYVVRYRVVDLGGNETIKDFEFTVSLPDTGSGGGLSAGAIIGICAGGAALVLGGLAVWLLVIKKKRA